MSTTSSMPVTNNATLENEGSQKDIAYQVSLYSKAIMYCRSSAVTLPGFVTRAQIENGVLRACRSPKRTPHNHYGNNGLNRAREAHNFNFTRYHYKDRCIAVSLLDENLSNLYLPHVSACSNKAILCGDEFRKIAFNTRRVLEVF